MNPLPGNLTADVISVPLLGRSQIELLLVDSDGVPLALDTAALQFQIQRNSDDGTPLLSYAVGSSIQILLPTSAGNVLVTFAPADVVNFLTPLWLFTYILTVTDVPSGQVILSRTGYLACVNSSLNQSFTITSTMPQLLSTSFVNVRQLSGLSGGAGYLDGIATVSQPVGCIVNWIDSNGQQESWILETSTVATGVGFQRPLDYSVTNTKVWRSLN